MVAAGRFNCLEITQCILLLWGDFHLRYSRTPSRYSFEGVRHWWSIAVDWFLIYLRVHCEWSLVCFRLGCKGSFRISSNNSRSIPGQQVVFRRRLQRKLSIVVPWIIFILLLCGYRISASCCYKAINSCIKVLSVHEFSGCFKSFRNLPNCFSCYYQIMIQSWRDVIQLTALISYSNQVFSIAFQSFNVCEF